MVSNRTRGAAANRALVLMTLLAVIGIAVALSNCGGSSSSLASLAVSPSSPDVVINSTTQFTATGKKDDGSSTTPSVTWSTGNGVIATIDSNGVATGVAAGTTTVTATSGALAASTLLIVSTSTLQSILISPTLATVSASGTAAPSSQQFTATGFFADGSALDITSSVNWNSSNTTNAVIGVNTGLATGFASGTVTITANAGSLTSNQATLNIIP